MKQLSKAKSWRWIYNLLAFFSIVGCTSNAESHQSINHTPELTDEQQYFLRISLEGELSGVPPVVKKWNQNINIFVVDTTYSELMDELDQIVDEINDLSATVTLRRAKTRVESNYLIYFGNTLTYATDYEPAAASLVERETNKGAFWIYWDGNYRIIRGSMYVNTEREQLLNCQKHTLREEITQSLGLMQDTDDFPTSIFYQSRSCGTQYADIDKQLIRWQLSEEIKAGMNRSDIVALWNP
ncbi:MAG: DUF2927 domain-containing protein [Bacteroidota bacterium]